ncbi:MAG: hypothetical protein ACE5D6_07135, partial [Candidatus Zixiibacteriota bacterium]
MNKFKTLQHLTGIIIFSLIMILPNMLFGYSVDFTAYAQTINDNVGFGPYSELDWDFELDARTMINTDNNTSNPITEGVPGTIFFGGLDKLSDNGDSFFGVGVQSNEWDSDKDKYKGSKAISGEGKHQDEALIINFIQPQYIPGIVIGLLGINPSKDCPDLISLTIIYSDNSVQTFSPANEYLSMDAEGITILDLSMLTNTEGSYITHLAVRSLSGHFGVAYLSSDMTLDTDNPMHSTPNRFKLSTNFPNPFNPSTTIEYNLPSRTIVEITIYNLLGQEIKKLVNDTLR